MRCFRTLLTGVLLATARPAVAQTVVPIDVHAAYLHSDHQDATNPAIPILLSALGLYPGYTIRIEAVGDWNAGPGGDVQTGSLGIFSSSSALLAPNLLHRVPDAIDAGPDNNTGSTWPSGEPCDIPEDFFYASGASAVTITIPPGATHLFVSVADIYYLDNSDPDGDFGVKITLISTTDVARGGLDGPNSASAYPNPFAGGTTLRFRSMGREAPRLTIYDSAGRRVRALAGGFLPAGEQRVWWDGRDDRGTRVAPGSYFARIGDDGRVQSVRVNVIH